MIRFLERARDKANVIGICMGDQGTISRILGPRSGSVFTFASVATGEETAPGQISARTLLNLYRIGSTRPGHQSLWSGGKSGGALPFAGDAQCRLSTGTGELGLSAASDFGDQGLAHAYPRGADCRAQCHDAVQARRSLKHLQNTDPLSERIGACNTVVRSADGKLYGFNTDVAAIVSPLEKRLALKGAKILVIGAGGAARAAVFGLQEKGAEIHILNRTVPTAQKLAREAKAKTVKREQMAKSSFDVIINATPVGMRGAKQKTGAQAVLEANEINASAGL